MSTREVQLVTAADPKKPAQASKSPAKIQGMDQHTIISVEDQVTTIQSKAEKKYSFAVRTIRAPKELEDATADQIELE